MEGAGIFALLGLLLVAPFELWQARGVKRRFLSPGEIARRRATRPLGTVAVLLWGAWFFGASARGVTHALAPVLLDPAANWLLLALLAAALLYGFASFVTGASRCWGMRSDGMLPVWAFFKCAVGVGGLVLLRRNALAGLLGGNLWAALLWLALNVAAVWCIAVGAARLLLLTVGGGNALRTITRAAAKKNAPLRAARRRWWQWW